MNYINHITKIGKFLNANMDLDKKFDLCMLQLYLIKKYMKKLINRR